jgi:hypothetical protein
MVPQPTPQSTVLLQGDSTTASVRREDPDGALADGCARPAAELIRAAHLRIRRPQPGTSGNRMADLRIRWDEDAMELAPDPAYVLIGVHKPFLLPVTADRRTWQGDPEALPAGGLMNQAAHAAGSTDPVVHDGVRPTPFGHRVSAQAWAD